MIAGEGRATKVRWGANLRFFGAVGGEFGPGED